MELTERQHQIVNTAIRLIASQGIQNLTIKNLAQAIGFSEPALYRHFDSKYAILEAILQRFESVTRQVRQLMEQQPPVSGIRKIDIFLTHRYQLFAADPEFARVLFSEEIFQNEITLSRLLLGIMDEHRTLLVQAIRQAQSESEIRSDIGFNHLFHIIVGSMRLLVNRWCYSGYAFDLVAEGQALWQAIRQIIQT